MAVADGMKDCEEAPNAGFCWDIEGVPKTGVEKEPNVGVAVVMVVTLVDVPKTDPGVEPKTDDDFEPNIDGV